MNLITLIYHKRFSVPIFYRFTFSANYNEIHLKLFQIKHTQSNIRQRPISNWFFYICEFLFNENGPLYKYNTPHTILTPRRTHITLCSMNFNRIANGCELCRQWLSPTVYHKHKSKSKLIFAKCTQTAWGEFRVEYQMYTAGCIWLYSFEIVELYTLPIQNNASSSRHNYILRVYYVHVIQ